jgi:glycosyltransferase involved in cell wall biosynthesis
VTKASPHPGSTVVDRTEDPAQSAGFSLRGKRVVILLENLPYPQDRRVRLEAETLRSVGATVTVLAPAAANQRPREIISEVDVRRFFRHSEGAGLGGYLREYLSAFYHFARLLREVRAESRIDVIHACTPPDIFFPLGWLYRLTGTRFVFDHHDLSPELFLEKGGTRWSLLYWAIRLAEWLSFRSASVVIASSKPIADQARRRGGLSPDRVFLVRTGVREDLWRETTVEMVPRRKDHAVIGYIGVMSHHDGLDLLVEAARVIRYDLGRSDIRWLLIGDGPERTVIETRIADLRMRDLFRFTGFVSGEAELGKLLREADVCVTPDPLTPFNASCLMAKVLDYLAAGRAQVAFPLPETREVAGTSALYVNQNSASAFAHRILELVDDGSLRRRLEEEARSRARLCRWQHSTESLFAAYSRAVGYTG